MVKNELGKDFKVDLKIDRHHFLVERNIKDNRNIDVSDYSNEMGQGEVIGKNEDD